MRVLPKGPIDLERSGSNLLANRSGLLGFVLWLPIQVRRGERLILDRSQHVDPSGYIKGQADSRMSSLAAGIMIHVIDSLGFPILRSVTIDLVQSAVME